jgi:hypothetical protein
MKNIFKPITLVILAGLTFFACETTELGLTVSPNELAPTQSDPNLLLNSIQLAYASNQDDFGDVAAQLTRIEYFNGRNYFNGLPGTTLNAVWARTYSSSFTIPGNGNVDVGILTNIQTLEAIDAESEVDYSFHIGVGKIMYAHSLLQLVDMLGGAAFSQAGNAAEFPAPALDSGEEVYAGALGILAEAEALLASGPDTQGSTDMFYGGDTEKWIKAINSIRLRTYKNTGNKAAFDAIVAGDNYISSADDDFQFQYGVSELQPSDRHPDYETSYTPTGVGPYRSNWLMNLMLENNDPRIRYYFYRQANGVPGAIDVDGNAVPPNEETISCSFFTPPAHYDGFVFCSTDNGYWGRSHGNDEGGPPDGFLKAAPGVYPAGGRFDDSQFGDADAITGVLLAPGVGLGQGGGGAGIEPIILSSYVDFWIGEMATTDMERAAALQAGLEKSIAKVQTFGALDGSADGSVAPSEDDVETYISDIVAAYNAATGDAKQNIFAEQYFTTLYGGGFESYNYYRKTGFPTTVAPNWELDPGPFPRTLLFPQNEVLNNPNLSQKTDLTTQVFWDTNPSSPTFPPAN